MYITVGGLIHLEGYCTIWAANHAAVVPYRVIVVASRRIGWLANLISGR